MFQIDDSDEEEIELTQKNFDTSPFDLNNLINKKDEHDITLFNKKNIASDASSIASSCSSENENIRYNKPDYISNSDTVSSDNDTSVSAISVQKNKTKNIFKDELAQKREILYQMDRLKSKGVNVPYNFTMNSGLLEMQSAYDRIVKEKEIDGSVRFQRKMMMGFITGLEYLNTRYDPLTVQLDGWSEQVHENINDYDEVFEELHDKYKGNSSQMAPELKLLVSLSGSAFMFHLTKRMFSQSNVPDVESVLKENPELMKQFQQASAKSYMNGSSNKINMNELPQNTRSGKQPQEDGTDMFGMISNMFGMNNTSSNNTSMHQMNSQNVNMNDLHQNINMNSNNDDDGVEMLSISDDEINSIISDAMDMKITNNKTSIPSKKKSISKNLKRRVLDI
jgi:hypothetical protein